MAYSAALRSFPHNQLLKTLSNFKKTDSLFSDYMGAISIARQMPNWNECAFEKTIVGYFKKKLSAKKQKHPELHYFLEILQKKQTFINSKNFARIIQLITSPLFYVHVLQNEPLACIFWINFIAWLNVIAWQQNVVLFDHNQKQISITALTFWEQLKIPFTLASAHPILEDINKMRSDWLRVCFHEELHAIAIDYFPNKQDYYQLITPQTTSVEILQAWLSKLTPKIVKIPVECLEFSKAMEQFSYQVFSDQFFPLELDQSPQNSFHPMPATHAKSPTVTSPVDPIISEQIAFTQSFLVAGAGNLIEKLNLFHQTSKPETLKKLYLGFTNKAVITQMLSPTDTLIGFKEFLIIWQSALLFCIVENRKDVYPFINLSVLNASGDSKLHTLFHLCTFILRSIFPICEPQILAEKNVLYPKPTLHKIVLSSPPVKEATEILEKKLVVYQTPDIMAEIEDDSAILSLLYDDEIPQFGSLSFMPPQKK